MSATNSHALNDDLRMPKPTENKNKSSIVISTTAQMTVLPTPFMSTVISSVTRTETPFVPGMKRSKNFQASSQTHFDSEGNSKVDAGVVRKPYPSSSEGVLSKQPFLTTIRNQSTVSYEPKRVFKVIIIGDSGVGKTCLSFRFCNGRFPAHTEATIGVDFRERAITIDNEIIKVQLWDTAGQERYRQSIISHYYRNVNAVVFVYDVGDQKSFNSLAEWIAECRRHFVSSNDDIPHILIGNKCDLASEKKVKTDYAQIFADQNNMALFETSTLSDSEADHVESIFLTLVHKLQQCKPMHVQSATERARKEERILLKASEAAELMPESGWCC